MTFKVHTDDVTLETSWSKLQIPKFSQSARDLSAFLTAPDPRWFGPPQTIRPTQMQTQKSTRQITSSRSQSASRAFSNSSRPTSRRPRQLHVRGFRS